MGTHVDLKGVICWGRYSGSESKAASSMSAWMEAVVGAGSMPCKSSEWLQEELEVCSGASLLLLDRRPYELESSHMETAINLTFSSLVLHHLAKDNLPIHSIRPGHTQSHL